MHRGILLLIAVVSLLSQPHARSEAQSALPKSIPELARESKSAIVTIIARDRQGQVLGQGTGFVVSKEGDVATNWHVINGASSLLVATADGHQSTDVRFVGGNEALDVAVVRIPVRGIRPLNTTEFIPEVGEPIVAIGNPLGLERSISDGIVSGVRVVDGSPLIQLTAPISPGSSGGPVMDLRGRVVGITTLYLSGGQQLNFAVPVRYATALLNQNSSLRPFGSVFSGSTSAENRSLANESARSGAETNTPRLAQTIREDVSGVYYVQELSQVIPSSGSPYSVPLSGFFVLAPDDCGFLVLHRADTGPEDPVVLYVKSVLTNSNGQVAVGLLSRNFDGYQTDDGLVLWSQHQFEGSKFVSKLTAKHTLLPLSNPTGIYRLGTRTYWTSRWGRRSNEPDDFAGDGAVVLLGEKVYMSIALRNNVGGGTRTFLTGRFQDGRIDIASESGDRLTGALGGGVIQGEWINRREDGSAFIGKMEGRRR